MFDLNDAQPQMAPLGALIPDGTFAKLQLKIRPGGVPDGDKNVLTAAKEGDVRYLDCELTILSGPLARRKFWQKFTVQGGKSNKDGESIGWGISRSTFRAMIESATGIDPKDMSEGAKKRRQLKGFAQLDGIIFAARIMIEPGNNGFQDQNKIANVVLRGDAPYEALMRGEDVEADPIKARPRTKKPAGQAGQAQGNAWGGDTATATSQPASVPAGARPAWVDA